MMLVGAYAPTTHLNITQMYIIKLKGGDVMKFDNIIDQITDLVIIYYINYRNHLNKKHNRCYKSFDNIRTMEVHAYMKSIICESYYSRYTETTEICNIDILPFPYETIYELNKDDKYIGIETLSDIVNRFITYIHTYTNINNMDEILSINVCPFDGISLRHGIIMRYLDLYFY